MSYRGKVQNGVVVLPPEVKLPEGTEVQVVPLEASAEGDPAHELILTHNASSLLCPLSCGFISDNGSSLSELVSNDTGAGDGSNSFAGNRGIEVGGR
jgi:hypothetical protein